MSYELLKQLKKAGFPLEYNHAQWLLSKKWEIKEKTPENEYFGYEMPNLSDLIDACGVSFNKLESSKETRVDENDNHYEAIDSWVAYSDSECGKGITPEEAVGYLYLELITK